MKKKAVSQQMSNIIWAIIKFRKPKKYIVNGGKIPDEEFERVILNLKEIKPFSSNRPS